MGAAGLDLGNGSQSITVQGSVFTDISGNGIELGGVDLTEPSAAALTKDNRIVNNHIYDMPVEYHGGVGILAGYGQNNLVAHNQINNTAYTAISMGWGGWPDKIQMAATPNPSKNNQVSNNLIFDHMRLLADGGAIYNALAKFVEANKERLVTPEWNGFSVLQRVRVFCDAIEAVVLTNVLCCAGCVSLRCI